MILHIAARELKGLFLSPMAWSILAVVEFILAYLFLAQIDTYMQYAPQLAGMEAAPGVTDIVVAPLFGNAAVILLLVAPLITMRVLSEEKRNRTLTLLMSAIPNSLRYSYEFLDFPRSPCDSRRCLP